MKRLAGLFSLILIAHLAYAVTVIEPSCTPCNLGDNLTISIMPDPIITTTNKISITEDLKFSPNVTSVITGEQVYWTNNFGIQLKVVCQDTPWWESAYMAYGQTVNGTFSSHCHYQLYNLTAGPVYGVVGDIKVNPVPSLIFNQPVGQFSKEIWNDEGTLKTSHELDGTSQTGEWTLNFDYTRWDGQSYSELITVNITDQLNINATPVQESVKQWQNIVIEVELEKADGRSLEEEDGQATCTDLTEPGKSTAMDFTGGSFTCTIENITQRGAHQASVSVSWKNNSASTTTDYNVTRYYDAEISAETRYSIDTYANITVMVEPSSSDPATIDIDGTIYPIDLSTGTAVQSHYFTGTPRNASIIFDFTDTEGRTAYTNTSVEILNEYNIELLSATGRQESTATINVLVKDINNRTLPQPITVECTDTTEPAATTALTNSSTGIGFCILPVVTKFGTHSLNISVGNTGEQGTYEVEGYYLTRIRVSTTKTQDTDAINLLVPFNITVNSTDPNGVPKTGIPGNTGVPGCTLLSEYKWSCESRASEEEITATFSHTEETTGRVAYGQKTLTVTTALNIEVNRENLERIDPLKDEWTLATVKDATGQLISGATVQCWEGEEKLWETKTNPEGLASCVHNREAGVRTIKFTASWKEINKAEITRQYNFEEYTTPEEPAEENGGTISSYYVAPGMKIIEYPSLIRAGTENETIIRVTVENIGDDDSETNYLILPEIPEDWYDWQKQKVPKGEKKDLTIRIWIPAGIEQGEYKTSLILKGSVCGQKKVDENGTYYYTSGTCDTKETTIEVSSIGVEKIRQLETRINETTEKEKELLLLIQELQALGLRTEQIQALLDDANQQISTSKSELEEGRYKNTENSLEAAENLYSEGITTSSGLLNSVTEPLVRTIETKIKELRDRAPEGSEENIEKASLLLTQAKNQISKNDYSKAKRTLEEAYALIKGIAPAEKEEVKEMEEEPGGMTLPLWMLFTLVVVISGAGIGIMKKEQIKELLENTAESITKPKIKKLTKHAWPTKLRQRVENTVSVNMGFRNTGKNILKDIEIKDLVPISFKIEEGSFLLNNKAVIPIFKNTVQGTMLEWRLRELKPGESIILAYKIKIVPVGDIIKIPPVTVKYKDKDSLTKVMESEPALIEVTNTK